MAVHAECLSDIEAILSYRYDNGADFWTTPDKRLLKGSPFSAYNSTFMLMELRVELTDTVLEEVAELFFSIWQEDGRFKLYPQGGILPRHTAHAAHLLCRMGYVQNERIRKTLRHLLETQSDDEGLRRNRFSFGRGPETESSNPGPVLIVLSAFRFTDALNREPVLDRAASLLLEHWMIEKPVDPCRYGIGTLLMQVEYPFGDYNLFQYVYVLSFYNCAKKDKRFLEALAALQAKLVNAEVVTECVVPKLAKLSFCQKGRPSEPATMRYQEILVNLDNN